MIKIAINKKYKNKPDYSKIDAGDYTKSFINHDIDINEFVDCVRSGYAFCSALTQPYRNRINFLSSQILALDFDTDDELSSFDYLANIEFVKKYASFIYTTPSHTPLAPRARVVFKLSNPVYNGNAYQIFLSALINMFNSDAVCRDATRVFYGSEGCDVLALNNTLPLKLFEYKYARPYAKERKKIQDKYQKIVNQNAVFNVHGTYMMNVKIEEKLNALLAAPKGARSNELLKTSFYIGGLISGGYNITEEQARVIITDTATNAWGDCSMRTITKTINNGLNAGLNTPITLHDLNDISKYIGQ